MSQIKYRLVRLSGYKTKPGRVIHVQMACCLREVLCPERPQGEGTWVVEGQGQATCPICARGLRLLQLVEAAGPAGYTAADRGESKTLQHLSRHGHVRCIDQGEYLKMRWMLPAACLLLFPTLAWAGERSSDPADILAWIFGPPALLILVGLPIVLIIQFARGRL